jgi:sugar lactone lactonase YvrE
MPVLLQGRGERPPAINRVNLSSMSSEVLLDSYQGKQFNSPNDVVLYCDGSIWFTGEAWLRRSRCTDAAQLLNTNALHT